MSTFQQSKDTPMEDSTPKKEYGGKEEEEKQKQKGKEEEEKPLSGFFLKLFGKKGGGKKEEVEKTGSVSLFKLFSFADPLDTLLMLFGIVGGMGNGLSMPLMSVVFGQTIDAFGNNSLNTDHILQEVSKVAVRFVYIGIGAAVTSFMQVTFWMITGERQSSRIRALYLKAILRQDVTFFDTEGSTGEVVGRMSGDIVVIQEAMGEKVGTFLQLTSTFFGGFIIAFIKGWKLTLVMLGTIPLIAIASGTMVIIIGKMSTKGQDAYAEAGDIVEQTIGAIRTVLSFTGEKKAVQDYKLALNKAYKASIQQGLASGLGIGFSLMVMFCSYGLALWYGSKLIVNEGYSGGRVWNVIFAVLTGGMSMGQVAPSVNAFASGKAVAYKMFEVIKRIPDIDVYNQNGKFLDTIKGNIEFQNVKFSYPTRPDVHVFSDFCLEIPSSTTTALVGESGSGKSTVINLIERFYDPQGGKVMLDGIDLKEVQLRSLRQHIGLVSQEPVLFGTSIFENITYGKDGVTQEEIEAVAKVANAANFINQMPKGYDTIVGEHGSHLSGGQKQRVAIARAILKNPRILLLDEATSALDSESEHLVQEALEKVMISRTTIVVAHRLTTIKKADAIAVVHDGMIVEKGSHNNLIQNTEGAYYQLIKLQEIQHGKEEEGQESADWNQYVENPISAMQQGSFRISSNMGGSGRSLSSPSQTIEIKGKKSFSLGQLKSKKTEVEKGGKKKSHVNTSLARLAALNKPEIPIFLVGSMAAIAHGFMFPIFGLLISSILSTFFKPADELRKGANFWALMFVVLAIGGFIVVPTQIFSFSVGGSKLVRRIRILAYEKVVRQEISWFDETENSSGAISTRLSMDAAQVKNLVGDALAIAMQNLATIVASLVIAFTASWELALVIIAVVPLLGLQGIIHVKLLKGFSADAKVMYEEASQVANDGVSSIRTVASFCAEDKVLDLYKQKCQTPIQSGIRTGLLSGFGIGVANFVMFSTNGFCFWFGSKLVQKDKISFEDVLRVFFAITIGAFGIARSTALTPDIAKVKIAVNSIFSVLDRKSQIDPYDRSGGTLTSVVGNIEFNKVNFKYPTRPDVHIFQLLCLSIPAGKSPTRPDVHIFQRLRLSIPAGKTVALVGESGSGKSTSVSLLQRFYDPDSGAILLDGSDIKRLQVKWLRQQMGLVSQEPILFNDSIQANIAYGKDGVISSVEIIAAAEASNAHGFISGLPDGYNTRVGERGIQLSGGQKQRVAIARAIVKNPKILLLDEATSALDAESEHIVQDALEKVMVGKSTLVIAHRLSTIRNADIIAVLKNGTIVERGKHKELMSIPDGAYASLVKLHMSKHP